MLRKAQHQRASILDCLPEEDADGDKTGQAHRDSQMHQEKQIDAVVAKGGGGSGGGVSAGAVHQRASILDCLPEEDADGDKTGQAHRDSQMHQEKQIDAVVAKGGGGSGGGVSAGVVAMRGMQSVPRVSTFAGWVRGQASSDKRVATAIDLLSWRPRDR